MALNDLNLIPAELMHQRARTRHLTAWVTVTVAVPLLIWIWCTAHLVRAYAGLPTAAAVQSVRREFGMACAELTSVQEELQGLSQIRDLIHARSLAGMLHDVVECTPATTHIHSLSVDRDPSRPGHWTVTLAGSAPSPSDLGSFLALLQANGSFAEVELAQLQCDSVSHTGASPAATRPTGFQIRCLVPPPGVRT